VGFERVNRLAVAIAVAAVAVAAAAFYFTFRERETLDSLLEKARRGDRFEVLVAGLSGGSVPARYTCDGEDVSPRVEWRGLPAGARSLVLICYDPDAPRGTFVHWVLYNVPPSLPGLPENLPKTGVVEGVGLQGVNDFGRVGYGGPCPPSGTHRYVFLVLALDSELGLREGASAFDVLREALPHVIGYGEVVLRYSRG
jgi:Raf kinase inhibitor-like YbhB/YbcL family protein